MVDSDCYKLQYLLNTSCAFSADNAEPAYRLMRSLYGSHSTMQILWI